MKYLAHIEGEREQTIKEHSIGTAELAAMFAKAFGKDDWGYCVGMLHDISNFPLLGQIHLLRSLCIPPQLLRVILHIFRRH